MPNIMPTMQQPCGRLAKQQGAKRPCMPLSQHFCVAVMESQQPCDGNLLTQYDMMQVGPKSMQGCAEQMQTVMSQSDCAGSHYSLYQAARHL